MRRAYPISPEFLAIVEAPIVVNLTSVTATTATAIGSPITAVGVRRVILSAKLVNEETGARVAVEFCDGNSATVIGYLSAADGGVDILDSVIEGYVADASTAGVQPTYKLTASVSATNRAVLSIQTALVSWQGTPPTLT